MAAPKLFVSYSWTSPDHEAWVLNLATELRECGVDVILDKWDLKEGHDAHVFMEKMVTDPEIQKVILVCDRVYAEKTDGRSGGVGTEAQIISGKIYESAAQDKFVAVVVERDSEGHAYLPAYYRSRIFIDLSDPGMYSENFDRLLRWVFNKPLYSKPEVGTAPSYLTESAAVALATSARYKRAVDAIRGGRDFAIPATDEYFGQFAAELEKLRIAPQADPFDEAVIANIETFMPYRNEAVELFTTLALYRDTPETGRVLHRFFESLIPYLNRPSDVSAWNESDFDNFKFIIHELFLYAMASLIHRERFATASYLMSHEYYVAGRSDYGTDAMATYGVFRQPVQALRVRNDRLKLRRLSVHADLLKERCRGTSLEYRHLMQADFVLFLRGELAGDFYGGWWPETLLHAQHQSLAFEVFARAKSAEYFDQCKVLLGVESKTDVAALLDSYRSGQRQLPRWEFRTFSPGGLLGFEQLATSK